MDTDVVKKRRMMFEGLRSNTDWYERNGTEYLMDCIQDQWIGFNAALDSVEIELPDVRSAIDIVYFNADVIDSIEATGLGLRVK